MIARYADASALLRVLFSEPGPAVPLESKKPIVSSRIVEIEAFRALDRARLTGELDDEDMAQKSKELRSILKRIHLMAVSDDVIERASRTFPVNLRALDAVHVATAELLVAEGATVDFWTHDKRQGLAATARGLDVHGLDVHGLLD